MKNPRIRLGLLCSSLLLTACDPKHETTSDMCSAGEDTPVRANYESFVVAQEDKGEYRYYLENILMGMTPDSEHPVSAETLEALEKIKERIKFYMGYEVVNGEIISSNNPLDFIEHLVASEDPEKVIGAFEDAQSQLANGIAADDGVCNYNNDNIELSIPDTAPEDEIDTGTYYRASYSLTYTPFDRSFVQQALVLQADTVAPDDINGRLRARYTGFYQAPVENFTTTGFTVPAIRQASMNNEEGTENISFDDDTYADTSETTDIDRIGQVLLETLNTYCEVNKENATPDPSQFVVSGDRDRDGVIDGDLNGDRVINSSDYKSCSEVYKDADHVPVVRPPAKAQCGGNQEDPALSSSGWFGDVLDWLVTEFAEPVIDEADKIEIRSFDLTDDPAFPLLRGLQRVRVEVDYERNETRIYGSKYREAIYDPVNTLDIIPGVTPYIENPTRCEKQAVLDELYDVAQSGVFVTARPDPHYDITYQTDENGKIILVDENGNQVLSGGKPIVIEPMPLLTFQGRPVTLDESEAFAE